MKKITIGDSGWVQRDEDEVFTVRREDALEVGEVVAVRFKDEFQLSPYRDYRCIEAEYRDDWDRQTHRRNFRLRKEEK